MTYLRALGFVAAATVLATNAARAQSLAALAQQEAARRALGEPAPVYTEVDVSRAQWPRGVRPDPIDPRLERNRSLPADAAVAVASPTSGRPSSEAGVHTAAVFVVGGSAFAGGEPSPSGEQQAVFDLRLNEVAYGEVVIVLSEGKVWLPVSALERVRLGALAGPRNVLFGSPHVELGSLAPAVLYTLDDEQFVLRLQARPELMARTSRDLGFGAPADLAPGRNTSGFVNYGVNWRGASVYDMTVEGGLSLRGALLLTTLSRSSYSPMLRGLSSLTIDDRTRMARWTLGDAFVPGGPLGGSLVMGGVGVAREFAIDPYFVRYPTATVTGNAPTPAVADIYVNDHLLRREYLPPGNFSLRNLPTPSGRGVTRVVLRDAFGREQQIVSPYFVTTALLARGLHEYRYHVGFRREQQNSRSWDYGEPAVFARHRVGFTNAVSGGLQLEATSGFVAAGPTVTARLPVGEAEVSGSYSRQAGGTAGAAGSLVYTLVGRPFSAGGFVRGVTDRYTSLGYEDHVDRPRFETSVFAGLTLGRRASLSVRQGRTESLQRGIESTTTVSASVRPGLPVDLFVNASRVRASSTTGYELFAGASVSLGGRSTANVSVHDGQSGRDTTIEMARSLPRDEGWGYRARLATGAGTPAQGMLQYQGPWGRYELGHEQVSDRSVSTVSVAGGIAVIGGGLYPTRPIPDAFALVRVPGVRGVRAYFSHQEVGRTGRRGAVLVPNLLSHYGNVLGIADDDVPMDRALSRTEATVAPPNRGGAVVDFAARPLRSVTGSLRVRRGGEDTTPRYGQFAVQVGGVSVESPIGSEGEFFLEFMAPGLHAASIEYRGEVCRFTLGIPALTAPTVDIGRVVCEPTLEPPR